jgi:integrase
VPLLLQTIAIVEELLTYKSPAQHYFLCHRSEPQVSISENTLNGALKRMGYKDRPTGHGIRTTISTALNELRYDKDLVEAQLSYADKDTVRGAYNHAKYVEKRRKMMQEWAERLDEWEQESVAQYNK